MNNLTWNLSENGASIFRAKGQKGTNLQKDLQHFWLGYILMLGHLQMSAHLHSRIFSVIFQ